MQYSGKFNYHKYENVIYIKLDWKCKQFVIARWRNLLKREPMRLLGDGMEHMTSLKGRQQTLCISQSHNYFTFSSVGMFLSLGAGPGLVLLSLGFGAENLCRKMNCKGWKWCFCYILAAHMPSSASLHVHQLNILQHMGILAARGAFQNPETSGFRAY